MEGDMGVLKRHEIDKLMQKLSRQRARVIKEFCTKVYQLDVGQELYQNYLSYLPKVSEIKALLNDESSTFRFEVFETINGVIVRRLA